MAQITLLIDEDKDRCAFAVCEMDNRGRVEPLIVKSGVGNTVEVIEMAVEMYSDDKVKVACDAIGPGSRLHAAATHYRWQILKPKNNEFAFVGFICGLNVNQD